MDIKEILQTAGQYIGIAVSRAGGWFRSVWTNIYAGAAGIKNPTVIKLFGNDKANRFIFFSVIAYLVIMNIWSFALFKSDKKNAKRKEKRIAEKKLFRVVFWGGAFGAVAAMNMFHHKTQKRKFAVGIPLLFVLQLVIFSVMIGFLGFWTFF